MLAVAPSFSLLARLSVRDPDVRAAIGVTLLFFTFTLVVFTVAGYFRGPDSFGESLRIGVPMMVVDGLIAFQLFYLLRWSERMSPVLRWPLIAIGVIAVALLQSVWDTQLRIWAGTVLNDFRTPYLAYVRAATLNVYNSGMFAALLAFQASITRLRENERLLRASQASERDAHMLALRFQLNPHFLFNTLNAISSLVIVGRGDEAEIMIDRLSSFLRASLSADPNSLVTVAEEFEMIESYLEIESVRFGERLLTAIDLPDHVSEALIPPFLLQPLVENAIKYAVAPSSRPVEVRIAAEHRDGELVLTIADDGNGCGDAAPGTGVGLANVRQRLRLNYGARARLEKSEDRAGCEVRIVMPFELNGDAQSGGSRSAIFA